MTEADAAPLAQAAVPEPEAVAATSDTGDAATIAPEPDDTAVATTSTPGDANG
jgi:hypothetical protein